MEADVTVAQRIVFKADALKVDFLAWGDILVVGLGVGQLGLVEVITSFGKYNPFLPNVDADAVDGSDVLTEELLLLKRSTVDDIEIHLHTVELQLVAQGDVVDELAGLVFDHVDGIGRLEDAEIAVPHQVVGIDALHGLVDKGRVAHLDEEMVLSRVVLVIQGCAHLIATYRVPKLSAVVDVYRVGVVFPAANGHDLLTSRQEEVVSEVPVEISPVSALEEGVGEADVGRVDALAQVIAELAAEGAVQGHDKVLAREAVVGAGGNRVVPRMVVEGEVGAGVQMQVVKGDKWLTVLRKGLQEGEDG